MNQNEIEDKNVPEYVLKSDRDGTVLSQSEGWMVRVRKKTTIPVYSRHER